MANLYNRPRKRNLSTGTRRSPVVSLVSLAVVWFVWTQVTFGASVESFSSKVTTTQRSSYVLSKAPLKRYSSPLLNPHGRWHSSKHPKPLKAVDSKKETSNVPSQSSRNSSSKVVLWTALSLLTTAILAAFTGILPGYSDDAVILLWRDVGATVLTSVLGYAFVQLNTWAVRTDRLAPRDARKIIHTFSAPLFILFWPLFSPAWSARVFAALVPTVNAVRLYLAASPDERSESDLAAAVSRSGNVQEALGGPFIYVIMLALSILLFWRDAPTGIVAMSCLAAGDGMADLCGRRWGASNPWPFCKNKSIAGSSAFFVASALTTTALLVWIQATTTTMAMYSVSEIALTATAISFIAAVVELVPGLGDDNYTVPISAAIMSLLLFPTN